MLDSTPCTPASGGHSTLLFQVIRAGFSCVWNDRTNNAVISFGGTHIFLGLRSRNDNWYKIQLARSTTLWVMFIPVFFNPPYPKQKHDNIKERTVKVIVDKLPVLGGVNQYYWKPGNSENINHVCYYQSQRNKPQFVFPWPGKENHQYCPL